MGGKYYHGKIFQNNPNNFPYFPPFCTLTLDLPYCAESFCMVLLTKIPKDCTLTHCSNTLNIVAKML